MSSAKLCRKGVMFRIDQRLVLWQRLQYEKVDSNSSLDCRPIRIGMLDSCRIKSACRGRRKLDTDQDWFDGI